jgi:hypothetical protein
MPPETFDCLGWKDEGRWAEYLRLQDDGCPNCNGHLYWYEFPVPSLVEDAWNHLDRLIMLNTSFYIRRYEEVRNALFGDMNVPPS